MNILSNERMSLKIRQQVTANCQLPTKTCSYIIFVMFISLLAACAKDTDPSGDLNGTYAGIYKETGEAHDSGTVKIAFVGSVFSGESIGTTRPICNGSYQITGDSINFKNLCSTPDPELLLAGNYKMTTAGDSLYFTRDTGIGIVYFQEQFLLKKQ